MADEGRLEDLAYALSLRALEQQERVLEELRARTGVLLAATALVASFLGGRALSSAASPWFTLPGVAAATASILLAVYLLAPKSKLNLPSMARRCTSTLPEKARISPRRTARWPIG